MAFNEEIKRIAMVACGRKCCICHKFCGNNMEVHHIKAHADGGEDTFENAIPLCFDCHAIVRQYDPKHPKGVKFSEKELIMHRNLWYEKIKNNNVNKEKNSNTEIPHIEHQLGYQNIMLHKVENGKELVIYLGKVCGMVYDEESQTLEEAKLTGDFIQYIQEIIDVDDLLEPSERIMMSFNLTENIKELDSKGFWVFVGKENRKLVGGVVNPEGFPVVLIRLIRKDSEEIVRNEVF